MWSTNFLCGSTRYLRKIYEEDRLIPTCEKCTTRNQYQDLFFPPGLDSLLEDGLIDETDFRKFAFSNSVQLYGGPNPHFFDGTRVEADANAELAA